MLEGEQLQRLIQQIEGAFAGVTLEDGIGLWEGQGLDEYLDSEGLAAYRARDQRQDWRALRAEDLSRCSSSLSFFDAKGMRFHLPAFLLAELDQSLQQDGVMFHLLSRSDFGRSKFDVLNIAQRQVVRQFLLTLKDHPDYSFERPEIERALTDIWSEPKG